MAFDERLAERVRRILAGTRQVSERRMMGGLCFMVRGHMCCGVDGSDLFVRMDREDVPAALRRKHAANFSPGGRQVGGFVRVRAAGVKDARGLRSWVEPAAAWACSLPPKKKPTRKKTAQKKR